MILAHSGASEASPISVRTAKSKSGPRSAWPATGHVWKPFRWVSVTAIGRISPRAIDDNLA